MEYRVNENCLLLKYPYSFRRRQKTGAQFDYQEAYREYGETIFNAYTQLQARSEKSYRRAEIVNEALNNM